MKIALAHDSLVQLGGAERVLEAFHELYPEAPVFTLVFDKKLADRFENWQIISSPLQYLYNFIPRLQYLLPFIPTALRFFDFSQFDVVLSSSSVWMKGIKVPKGVLHINYCHTPARFLWDIDHSYIDEAVPAYLKPLKPLLRFTIRRMRALDFRAAQRVDCFIANSHNVQERIKKYYNRESNVIFPYVDTDFFYPAIPKTETGGGYYLAGGRLHKHKRVDLVVDAFKKNGKELHVVGTGRAYSSLSNGAPENIVFLGKVDDEILRNEYSGARAFIYPQEEDAGIMPLESMACGTPVIAYGRGGAFESVTDKTGLFFTEQTIESLENALKRFEEKRFLEEDLFDRALEFSKGKFQDMIYSFVEQKANEHAHRD